MNHEISPEPDEHPDLEALEDDDYSGCIIEFAKSLVKEVRYFNPNGGELNDPRDIAREGEW